MCVIPEKVICYLCRTGLNIADPVNRDVVGKFAVSQMYILNSRIASFSTMS